MKVRIDREGCMASGICHGIEPSVFTLDADGFAQVQRHGTVQDSVEISSQFETGTWDAAQACPAAAIHIDD